MSSLHAEGAPSHQTRPLRWRTGRFRSIAFAATCLAAVVAGNRPAAALRGIDLAQLTIPPASSSTPAGIEQEGIYVTAPITLDGAQLFRVAAPASPSPGELPIELRATYVEAVLSQIVAVVGTGREQSTAYDPKTLRMTVRPEGDVALIEATDAKHRTPLPVITVTSVDARYADLTVDALAAQWQATLQSALVHALAIRQPLAEHRSLIAVLVVAAGLALLTLAGWFAMTALGRRSAQLSEAAATTSSRASAEQAQAAQADTSGRHRRRAFALALKAEKPVRSVARFRAVSESIGWLLMLVWMAAAIWALSEFPQTTPIAADLRRGAIGMASVIVITGLLNRLLDLAIARAANAWQQRTFGNSEDRARQLLRVPTVVRALSGFKTSILVFLAVLAIMSQVGVPIGSVVTIGGLAAIALSLAAQNFVRDFVNGFLVLFEDQYVVGDYVTINNFSGVVETLTLRMSQIRDVAGDLITVPHSSVTSVVNQSRNWSRVDYRVPVDPSADVEKALELVRTAIEGIANDDAWREAILEPIEWIGIDELSKDGIVLRASVRTAPLRQFELRRAINARVREGFAGAGIALGGGSDGA